MTPHNIDMLRRLDIINARQQKKNRDLTFENQTTVYRDFRDICEILYACTTFRELENKLQTAFRFTDSLTVPVRQVSMTPNDVTCLYDTPPGDSRYETTANGLWLGFTEIIRQGEMRLQSATIICHRNDSRAIREVEIREPARHRNPPAPAVSYSMPYYIDLLRERTDSRDSLMQYLKKR